MKIGVPGVTIPPVSNLIRSTKASEAAGFDSCWWPDHLMGWQPQSLWTPDITPLAARQPTPHIFLDPLVAQTAAAMHTERMTIGVAVTESFRTHPAMLAQAYLSLDHVSGGRTVLGLGAGEGENNEPYGIPFTRPVSRLEEALEIIRLLWASQGPVDFDGDIWGLRDAVMDLAPYDGRTPPIWLAAHGPRMLDLTARHADGWLPMGVSPAAYADLGGRLDARRAHHGRQDEPFTKALFQFVVVHEDQGVIEQILANPIVRILGCVAPAALFAKHGVEHPLGEDFYGLTDFIPSRLGREEALAAADAVPTEVLRDYMLVGTPDEIVDSLRAYTSAGCDHAILWNLSFLDDLALLGPSFELLSEIRSELSPVATA